MRGFTIVFFYLLAIAGGIFLQFIPIAGVFLMMSGAALWAGVLLNAMLVHIAVAVFRRRVPLPWIALPIGVYAAWGAFAWPDYLSAVRLRERLEAEAAAVPKLQPFPHTVLIDAPHAIEVAQSFVKVVDGTRVFANGNEFLMIDSADARCKSMPKMSWKMLGYTFSSQRRAGERSLKRDRCIIAVPAQIPDDHATLIINDIGSTLPYAGFDMIYNAHNQHVYMDRRVTTGQALRVGRRLTLMATNASGNASVGQIQQGRISYLWPIPVFQAGCGLNSAAASWDCVFGLLRRDLEVGAAKGFPFGGPDQSYYAAQAFGIPLRE